MEVVFPSHFTFASKKQGGLKPEKVPGFGFPLASLRAAPKESLHFFACGKPQETSVALVPVNLSTFWRTRYDLNHRITNTCKHPRLPLVEIFWASPRNRPLLGFSMRVSQEK